MCLIPVGTLQRETLWSMKGGVLPGAEPEQPLQMFLDTRQELYRMQTPSLSQNLTEKCSWTYRRCRFCEGVFVLSTICCSCGWAGAEWICLWTSILKALESGGCLGHPPLQLPTPVPPKGKKKKKEKASKMKPG